MLNAEVLPASPDLSVEFIDGGFVGKMLRYVLWNMSVVGIPGVPCVQEGVRPCCHDDSESAISNVLVTV